MKLWDILLIVKLTVFLTETWQKSSHSAVTATIKKYGYTPYHSIREHDSKSRGGGIGILCCNQYEVKLNKQVDEHGSCR